MSQSIFQWSKSNEGKFSLAYTLYRFKLNLPGFEKGTFSDDFIKDIECYLREQALIGLKDDGLINDFTYTE
jgi:hypothetical protein